MMESMNAQPAIAPPYQEPLSDPLEPPESPPQEPLSLPPESQEPESDPPESHEPLSLPPESHDPLSDPFHQDESLSVVDESPLHPESLPVELLFRKMPPPDDPRKSRLTGSAPARQMQIGRAHV
jgi:hypothetical protein